MCGIAGALDLSGRREFPTERLLAMTRAIAHRGPDDEAFHSEPSLAMGARRLSIVNLVGGRQPISNERGNIWVAFNGELFEYPELRRDLLARGHQLATRCDTEAWCHLYEDLGEGMFAETRGQFAVSLWDRERETLYLGRDRVGICPLYYTEREGWLLWCSEVKGLLASGLVDAQPDPKGIDHFFHFFAAGTTRTMFQGIKSIPPGHYLRVSHGRIERRQYWDLDFPDAGEEYRPKDPTPLVDELEGLLRQAVSRRLRGDVPVVSYISGGLDSTMVLGLSSQVRGAAVPSFTIGLDRAGPDERTQSAESAAALGSPLTTVTMDRSDIAAAYPELVRAAEGPVLDTSCACLLRLASAVHDQGYKVVLTGEGSDEALAGYVWFKAQKIRNFIGERFGLGIPKLLRRLMLRSVGGDRSCWPSRTPIGGARTAQQDLYDVLGQSRFHFYSGGMWDQIADHSAYDDLDITNENFGRWDPLNQSLYVGYKVMLAGMLLLSKGDRIAMNSSVETRYPFLDDDVISFCAGIDPNYKLHGMTDKWLLRQVAARTLPERIANRPKTMFRASLSKTFLDPSAPAWVDQLLSPESLSASGFFDPSLIAHARWQRRYLPRVTARQLGLDMNLTSVVATQLWYHTFCGGGLCELPTWSAPLVSSSDAESALGVSLVLCQRSIDG